MIDLLKLWHIILKLNFFKMIDLFNIHVLASMMYEAHS
jgi:hypothetical protein